MGCTEIVFWLLKFTITQLLQKNEVVYLSPHYKGKHGRQRLHGTVDCTAQLDHSAGTQWVSYHRCVYVVRQVMLSGTAYLASLPLAGQYDESHP